MNELTVQDWVWTIAVIVIWTIAITALQNHLGIHIPESYQKAVVGNVW